MSIPALKAPETPHPVLSQVNHSARSGAEHGMRVGGYIVAATCALGIGELASRLFSNAAHFPVLRCDCCILEFRDSPRCTLAPLFNGGFSFAICVIGATSLSGALVGAVAGATQGVWRQLTIGYPGAL